MKVADYIAARLQHWGLTDCFTVTGGGAMHLNDAFGEQPGISVTYCHHEQACAMAAEAYARVAGRPAVVNVTSGPGGINALNGVFGAFTDSVPMVVVAGQVRRDTMTTSAGLDDLRQLGDQEVRTIGLVAGITTWSALVSHPDDVPRLVDEAVLAATRGRPGPVWLDVPVDVQGSQIDADPAAPLPLATSHADVDPSSIAAVLDLIAAAQRPVILAGTGVRCADAVADFRRLVDLLGVPVTTAWTHDLIPGDHPLYAGRPGTIGTRAGNFVLQAADVVVVLGSRLNIRQVSYNWDSFASDATLVWVDIDPAELDKPYVSADLPIVADLSAFIPALASAAAERGWTHDHEVWVSWCQAIRARYEPRDDDYADRPGGINPYHLVGALSELLDGRHVVVSGDATACIVPFQRLQIRDGMRLFSNSGCASMGYDLPAAIGAAVAAPGRPVICLAGDGSIMMNLQELQTLSASDHDVLVVILDNGGYLSIKQTQRNFFGREHGASPESGVTFPDFAAVATAFGLATTVLEPGGTWRDGLRAAVAASGPRVVVAHLDRDQEFEPRLKSRMVGGVISTPPLDDMFPHLPDEELADVRASAPGRR